MRLFLLKLKIWTAKPSKTSTSSAPTPHPGGSSPSRRPPPTKYSQIQRKYHGNYRKIPHGLRWNKLHSHPASWQLLTLAKRLVRFKYFLLLCRISQATGRRCCWTMAPWPTNLKKNLRQSRIAIAWPSLTKRWQQQQNKIVWRPALNAFAHRGSSGFIPCCRSWLKPRHGK